MVGYRGGVRGSIARMACGRGCFSGGMIRRCFKNIWVVATDWEAEAGRWKHQPRL